MYKYRPKYNDRLRGVKSIIDEIADAEDTTFEYVVRDLYSMHYKE